MNALSNHISDFSPLFCYIVDVITVSKAPAMQIRYKMLSITAYIGVCVFFVYRVFFIKAK